MSALSRRRQPRALRVLLLNDNRNIPVDRSRERVIHNWIDAQIEYRRIGARTRTDNETQPDIVLCDINFEGDGTSPLAALHEKKPTGLLYAIPYLVQARILGMPSVVVFHTGDRGLFSRLHPKTEVSPVPHAFPLLAAELIGLITALDEGATGSPPLKSREEAWDWLIRENQVTDDTTVARKVAYQKYRERLHALATRRVSADTPVVLSPASYSTMHAWAEYVGAQSGPMTEDLWASAPGLELLLADGTTDSLSVRSLFSDVDNAAMFRRELFKLPSVEPTDPSLGEFARVGWRSRAGMQVGAFLYAIGNWSRLFDEAVRAARILSPVGVPYAEGAPVPSASSQVATDATIVRGEADNINRVVPDSVPGYETIRLLTLVFQAVRMYAEAHWSWERAYHREGWDHKRLQFEERCDKTLAQTLEEMFDRLRRDDEFSDGEQHRVSAAEFSGLLGGERPARSAGRDNRVATWIEFHLVLLSKLELIDVATHGKGADREFGVAVRRGARFPGESRVPSCPPKFLVKWVPSFRTGLANQLNFFGAGSYNEIARLVGAALAWISSDTTTVHRTREVAEELSVRSTVRSSTRDRQRVTYGVEFLKRMESGYLPGWLASLAREYTRKTLPGYAPEYWPSFIRVSEDRDSHATPLGGGSAVDPAEPTRALADRREYEAPASPRL